jgi:hypothetical protein
MLLQSFQKKTTVQNRLDVSLERIRGFNSKNKSKSTGAV